MKYSCVEETGQSGVPAFRSEIESGNPGEAAIIYCERFIEVSDINHGDWRSNILTIAVTDEVDVTTKVPVEAVFEVIFHDLSG